MYRILGEEIYTPRGVLKNGQLTVENGIIKSVGTKEKDGEKYFDLSAFRIIPGLIDIHIHGVKGHDTMDATGESLQCISHYLSSVGVTSFLAATVTDTETAIEKALQTTANHVDKELNGARLLGNYLEGPFLSNQYRGAHALQYLRRPTYEHISSLIEKSESTIKVVALAPELIEDNILLKKLCKQGIRIALAHTDATYKEAKKAVDAGASIVTHLYNGMRPFYHRNSGILEEALLDDRLYTEVICDGNHVSPEALRLAIKCKGTDKIILISDCMMAGGMPDGQYRLGAMDVTVCNGMARTMEGSLAGSTLHLMQAVLNMVQYGGITLSQAIQMGTLNPAKALGIDDVVGSLEVGKRGDVVGIDENFQCVFTMVDGKVVYTASNSIKKEKEVHDGGNKGKTFLGSC